MGYTPAYDARSLSVHIGTVGGGAMTAGSAALGPVGFTPLPGHATAQYFSVADVGRIVTVYGAGPSGGILIAKIASYVDTQHVVLDTAASTSVTADYSNTTVYRPCSVLREALQHDSTLTARDTASFTARSLDGTFVPVEGQPVLFTSTDPAVGIYEYGVFFGGAIDSVSTQNYTGSLQLDSECQCISWEHLATKRVMMGQKYLTTAAGTIFADIIAKGLVGDYVGVNAVAGPTVDALTIDDYTVVADALDRVSQAVSDAINVYYWKMDPWRRAIFALQTTTPAPWNISQTDGSNANILASVRTTRTRERYGNHAYVEASQQLNPVQTHTVKIGTVPVAPPPGYTSRAITIPAVPAVIPSMTLDGAPLVIKASGDDPRLGTATNPAGADWVWLVGTDFLWTDPSHAGLTVGHTIVVSYQTADAGHAFASHAAGVNERSAVEGGTGYHETVVSIDHPVSRTELEAYAESVAERYGQIPTVVDIETYRSGLRVGQSITIDLREVAGSFVISSANMAVQDGVPKWSVTATNGSVIGDWRTALVGAFGGGAGVAGGGGGGVRVGAIPLPLTLTAALANGTVGVPYSAPLIAAGGSAPYAFSISDGTLPAWATLETESGIISGTPTTAATTTFTARVTDSASLTQDFVCSLVIVAAPTGSAPPAPGDVTITSVEVDPKTTASSVARGSRNSSTAKRGITIMYDPPATLGTFRGVFVQIEAPDQTIAYSTRGGRPGRLLDGSHALSEIDLSGPKAALTFGPYAHGDSDGSIRVQIPEPDAAQLPMNARVRLLSYSDDVTNDPATAPSMTFVIPDATAAKPNSGTAYAPNPLSILIPATVPGSGIRNTGQSNPSRVTVSGVDETHLWVNLDLDSRAYGYQLILVDADGNTVTTSGIETASHFELVFNTPAAVGTYTVYACGSDGTSVNPLVVGITPSATVTLGTTDGTVDLTQSTATSRGRGLGVGADGLGIVDGGVTTDCIDAFAVSAAKIAAGAVETDKIADLSIITAKLAANAVNSTKLADLAVEAAKLADSSVTATKIANAAVGTAAIANLAVGTAHIQDSAISNAKIGNLAVSTGKIQDAAITTAKINNLAVTTALIADAAVTNAKINDLAANKITTGTISASISMTAPTISVTSGTVTVNIDAANHVKVTDTAFSSYAQMSQGSVMVQSTVDSSYAALQYVSGSGILRLKNSSNTTTVDIYAVTTSTANAGVATLPSNPAGFISAKVNGVTVKIPYYAN